MELRNQGDCTQAPSIVRVLCIFALAVLVCGGVGSCGYSPFFSSKDDGNKSSAKHAAGNESSDSSIKNHAGEAESGKESGQQVPPSTQPVELDTLRKQIEDLAKRVDGLDERFNELTLPRDQTSPEIRKLQVKMTDLAHAMERIGDPPTRLRHIEDRLEELHQQLKTLQSQSTGRQENAKGSTPPAVKRSAAPSADVPPGGVTSAP
jgi:hypothetical protein